ncbi:S4 domain protein YaaA [Granulicatella balaenopterae]|uniref:S4 domain protein YaaA n=1 Tax=Granulicatella balaenopterae TaxID=137733 RepID=A0A1H9NBV3_9LACT|nr:S4 domain-containing protein YaaA [Granulicatella balaenopterae]SER33368.1 S4 domain protein YaaA [Granulicatella balaenopterae]
MTKIVLIEDDFITLGRFLKHVDIISTGGQAKWYLQEYVIFVDGEPENRRGKKLFPGTQVEVPGEGFFIIKQGSEEAVEESELTIA